MKKDSLLTLKDWIQTLWDIQEEDLKFLSEDVKALVKNPKELINELRVRMDRHKTLYNLYPFLSWNNLSSQDMEWSLKKLTKLMEREKFITDYVNKILDILTKILDELEGVERISQDKLLEVDKFILH